VVEGDVSYSNHEAEVNALLEQGDALVNAGRLSDARNIYRSICELYPENDEAWYMTGLLSFELGELAYAAASLDQALVLNSAHPEALSLRGSLKLAEGDIGSALELYRRCVAADPEFAEAWTLLGSAQGAAGDYRSALTSVGRALALDARLVDAHLMKARILESLVRFPEALEALDFAAEIGRDRNDIHLAKGQLLLRLARPVEAQAAFSAALRIDARSAYAHEGLGLVYLRLENMDRAEHHLREALRYDAALPEAHRSLGMLLRGKGDASGALKHLKLSASLDSNNQTTQTSLCLLHLELGQFSEAAAFCLDVLDRNPGNLLLRQVFPSMLRDLGDSPDMLVRIRKELIRTFSTQGIDYEALTKPAMRLIQRDHKLGDIYQSLTSEGLAYIEDSIRLGRFSSMFGDKLLLSVLRYATICDVKFEQIIAAIKAACLSIVIRDEVPGDLVADNYAFPVSLACQCFHTEYSYAVDAKQEEWIKGLESLIAADMQGADGQDHLSVLRVIIYAMHRPLHRLACIDQLSDRLRGLGSESLNLLLKRQVDEVRRESVLRGTIRALTPIHSIHSRAVEAEYDASPYPRWLSAGFYVPEPCREIFRRRYAGYKDPGFDANPLNVLVAGCGTGRHAVLAASRFANAQVLAIDLSVASLAYAQRMTEELNVSNVTFQHADIMELPCVARKFHVIEAGGVLHNMESPGETLKIFADMLEENGLLYLATYRKAARDPVLEARELVRQKGFPKAPDGVRQARQMIMELAKTRQSFANMTKWRDFFTLSEARYLLFDVPEHTFELEQLYAMFEESGLQLLGFDLETPHDMHRYRLQNPEDPSISALGTARAFEIEYPSAFGGQYRCWCQKI
jgi:tetratricopeptide (TPR) repeat protein/ubiquinone/menaquinone biosynthesis C-methylase UbiE